MKKIGIILSGCGRSDGSEIHESVLTLLYCDQKGAETVCMAPDIDQHHVTNHLTGKKVSEKRNVLVESARIARGNIRDIKTVNESELDAIILPGGLGAAINLGDFAVRGENSEVLESVRNLLISMVKAGKPVGAICIAPATVAKALEEFNPEVTIGTDIQTAEKIEKTGAKHIPCSVDLIHVDKKNKIVSTPAYMLGPGIKDVASGIEKLVNKIIEMA